MASRSQPVLASNGQGEAEPSAAEWAVIRASYPSFAAVGPISKQTSQRIYHPDKWGHGREAFTDLSAVLYRGAEDGCKVLAERLMSSRALADQEQRASGQRHADRVENLVSAALAKAGTTERQPEPREAQSPSPKVTGDAS